MLNYVTSYYGDPGTTVTHACGDTAEALSDTTVALSNARGQRISSVLITVETKAIRGAFGTDPVVATPLGHVFNSGDAIRLFGPEVTQFKFLNAATGETATLQITPYFE